MSLIDVQIASKKLKMNYTCVCLHFLIYIEQPRWPNWKGQDRRKEQWIILLIHHKTLLAKRESKQKWMIDYITNVQQEHHRNIIYTRAPSAHSQSFACGSLQLRGTNLTYIGISWWQSLTH